ncbi:MAG: hypothetical protein JXR63_08510 [Spirochaetales bacterium]|nr:hypothetical protein [Spirochaetales bacterium]
MKKVFLILSVGLALFSCKLDNSDLFGDFFKVTPVATEGVSGDIGTVDKSVGTSEPTVSRAKFADKVELRWAAIEGVDGYVVYSKKAKAVTDSFGRIVGFEYDQDAKFNELAKLKGNATSYEDATVEFDSAYYYCIKAFKKVGEDTLEGLPSYAYIGWTLSAPSSVAATEKESRDFIGVSWSNVPFASKYIVERSISEEDNFQLVGETLLPYYKDAGKLANGPSADYYYVYRIAAVTKYGSTGYSPISSAGALVPPGAVDPPAIVYGSRAESIDTVFARWDAVEGATGYIVRRTDLDGSNVIETPDVATNEYADNTVEPGKSYLFYVACKNTAGQVGGFSKDIEVDGYPTPDADNCQYVNQGYTMMKPAYFGAAVKTDTSVIMSWDVVTGADSYNVYMQTEGAEPIIILEGFLENIFEYTEYDSSVNPKFAVSARRTIASGFSESELTDFITPLPSVLPVNFVANSGKYEGANTPSMRGIIDFSHENEFYIVKGFESKYKLYRKEPFYSDFTEVSGFSGNLNFVDTGLSSYSYAQFSSLLPTVLPQGGESSQDALKRCLSTQYRLAYEEDGVIIKTVETSGWKMLNHKEAFFLFKVVDHTASNKITYQITSEYAANGGSFAGNIYPNKDETDQGFLSGNVRFNPYAFPSLSHQGIKIRFIFTNYSDYHGLVLNGETYVVKGSGGDGDVNAFLNPDASQSSLVSSDLNETSTLTFFEGLSVKVNSKIRIRKSDSLPLSGTVYFDLFQGSTKLTHHEFPFTIFDEIVRTGNCPGGRNYTRGSETSSGWSSIKDPVDAPMTARIPGKTPNLQPLE